MPILLPPCAPSPALRFSLVLFLVSAVATPGCVHIQTPPEQTVPGAAGRRGDAGWTRVMQVEAGQEVIVMVRPPAVVRDGLEPYAPAGGRPTCGPPYGAGMEYDTILVSASRGEITLNPRDPLSIPRSQVLHVLVLNPGNRWRGAAQGAFVGALIGAFLGLVTAKASDSTSAGVAVAGSISGLMGVGGYRAPNWVFPARLCLYEVARDSR